MVKRSPKILTSQEKGTTGYFEHTHIHTHSNVHTHTHTQSHTHTMLKKGTDKGNAYHRNVLYLWNCLQWPDDN